MGNPVRSGQSKQARVGTIRTSAWKEKNLTKNTQRGIFSGEEYSISGVNISVGTLPADMFRLNKLKEFFCRATPAAGRIFSSDKLLQTC